MKIRLPRPRPSNRLTVVSAVVTGVLLASVAIVLAGGPVEDRRVVVAPTTAGTTVRTPDPAPQSAPTAPDTSTSDVAADSDEDTTAASDAEDAAAADTDATDDDTGADDTDDSAEKKCATSDYVPAFSGWIVLRNDDGDTLRVTHSPSHAHRIVYGYNNGTRYHIDVRDTIAAGKSTTIADGDVDFLFRSKIGTTIWNGGVRIDASRYKVVMRICGSWEQTAGIDIGLPRG